MVRRIGRSDPDWENSWPGPASRFPRKFRESTITHRVRQARGADSASLELRLCWHGACQKTIAIIPSVSRKADTGTHTENASEAIRFNHEKKVMY